MGSGVLHILARALRTATRPLRLAPERLKRIFSFFRDVILFFRDVILGVAGHVTRTQGLLMGALLVGLVGGIGGAVVFIRGADENPSVKAPTATVAAGLTPASATAVPTPARTAAALTSAPAANIITLRGEIEVTSMTAVGLSIPEHSVELVLFSDTGAVTGSMVIGLDPFPIGRILAGTFDAADDPAWAQFKDCTVRMTLDGVATGTYDPAGGTIQGSTLVTPVVEDVHHCVDTRPPNVSLDANTETSTFAWSANFDGRSAHGMAQLEPPTPFTATIVE